MSRLAQSRALRCYATAMFWRWFTRSYLKSGALDDIPSSDRKIIRDSVQRGRPVSNPLYAGAAVKYGRWLLRIYTQTAIVMAAFGVVVVLALIISRQFYATSLFPLVIGLITFTSRIGPIKSIRANQELLASFGGGHMQAQQ
jgi:hypothetical protein